MACDRERGVTPGGSATPAAAAIKAFRSARPSRTGSPAMKSVTALKLSAGWIVSPNTRKRALRRRAEERCGVSNGDLPRCAEYSGGRDPVRFRPSADVSISLPLSTGATMRTDIEIDDRLLAQAMRAGGFKTKRAAVEAGLRLPIRKKAYCDVLALRGMVHWKGEPVVLRGSKRR